MGCFAFAVAWFMLYLLVSIAMPYMSNGETLLASFVITLVIAYLASQS